MDFDPDGNDSRGFSTAQLIAAGVGGAVIGGVVVALVTRRSARQLSQPILPSGAAASQLQAASPRVRLATRPVLLEPPPGTPLNPNLRVTTQVWPRPQKGLIQGPMRKFATADALLRSCPTEAEMMQIRSDFHIAFAPGVLDAPWSCSDGGSESSTMLTVYNLFRLFYSMDFDAPIPLIGVTNVYQWLKSLNLDWYFRPSSPADAFNHADGTGIVLNSESLADPGMRLMFDPHGGLSIGYKLPLIVHEARHTDPGGGKVHTCSILPGDKPGSADSSLSYGGAYGLEYYYTQWLAQHSGSFLSADQKAMFADGLADYRGPGGRFCDEFHPALRGDELDPTFWWNWLGWLDRQHGPFASSVQHAWAGMAPQQRLNMLGSYLSGHIPYALWPADFPYTATEGVRNDPVDLDAERRVTALASNRGATRAVSLVADAIATVVDRPATESRAIPRATASNALPARR